MTKHVSAFLFCLLLEEKVPHDRMAAADEVLFIVMPLCAAAPHQSFACGEIQLLPKEKPFEEEGGSLYVSGALS